jgi:hypothetical protein
MLSRRARQQPQQQQQQQQQQHQQQRGDSSIAAPSPSNYYSDKGSQSIGEKAVKLLQSHF